MRTETVEKVKKQIAIKYRDRRPPAVGAYIENLVIPLIEEDAELARYAPMLEELLLDEEKVVLRDNRPGQNGAIVEVIFRDRVLYCNIDHSTDCLHVGFVMRIAAVNKVLKARGERSP